MIQISDKISNKLGSSGCFSGANAKLERRLSNENEKVSFEKLFTSELGWNGKINKAADKTKNEKNRKLRSKILQSQRWRKEEK